MDFRGGYIKCDRLYNRHGAYVGEKVGVIGGVAVTLGVELGTNVMVGGENCTVPSVIVGGRGGRVGVPVGTGAAEGVSSTPSVTAMMAATRITIMYAPYCRRNAPGLPFPLGFSSPFQPP